LKCEIAYLSQSGNTAMLANAVASMVSDAQVHLTDLSRGEAQENADVYCIGYGVNRGTVPMKVLDALDLAEGKAVALFVTCGLDPTEEYRAAVERKVLPFLPDDCDYRGLFLCTARFPEETVSELRQVVQQQPENQQARTLLAQCQKAAAHPDEDDLERLRAFLASALRT
jgi:flavodoxin